MPTYDYECQKCGKIQEVFHGINETPTTKCASCGGKMKRLIGNGGGIIFKGAGFYETDYKRKQSTSTSGCGQKNNSSCSSCPHNQ